MMFYTYIYFDEQMLPYYVGKGCSKRAFVCHSNGVPVPPAARILIQHWESEAEAFQMEMWWIALYGRKDLGTGLLRNQDDGGRAPSRTTGAKGGRIGGRVQGRKNAESGQIGSLGRSYGPFYGAKNVESGHMARIRTMGGRAQGPILGRKNVESGQIDTLPHYRWHVKRGVVNPSCVHCQEVV